MVGVGGHILVREDVMQVCVQCLLSLEIFLWWGVGSNVVPLVLWGCELLFFFKTSLIFGFNMSLLCAGIAIYGSHSIRGAVDRRP